MTPGIERQNSFEMPSQRQSSHKFNRSNTNESSFIEDEPIEKQAPPTSENFLTSRSLKEAELKLLNDETPEGFKRVMT